ncbi:MAG: hypothetical protein JJT75_15035 [Opitutales bacterium]|nr:hypothetical protein [Opitutales bacterium]
MDSDKKRQIAISYARLKHRGVERSCAAEILGTNIETAERYVGEMLKDFDPGQFDSAIHEASLISMRRIFMNWDKLPRDYQIISKVHWKSLIRDHLPKELK